MTDQAQPSSARIAQRAWLPALISALLGFVLFSVTIGGTYVYDDHRVVQQDARLGQPSLWWKYWTGSYNNGPDNLYRPLVSMSYALEWSVHGDRPRAFHLINVLLHAAVCACAAELARRLSGMTPAWIVGLLFAAHPVHAEAVANIAGRPELMCALGMFAALILFLKPLTRSRAIAITGCFLFAVLSKEQGLLLPPMLLALAILRGRLQSSGGAKLLLVMLLCWTLAGYLVWRETILPLGWDREYLDWTVNPMVGSSSNPHGGGVGIDRLLVPITLVGRYAALLIAPIRLSPDYGAMVIREHVELGNPYLYIGMLAIVGWLALFIFALVRKGSSIAFACLVTAALIGMVANLVALIGTIFAERLMYMPSLFFLMILASAIVKIPRLLQIGLVGLLLTLASVRTVSYAARWNEEVSFYQQSLSEQPRSIRLHMLLLDALRDRGRMEEAATAAAAARRFAPEYTDAWIQSGRVALESNQFDRAEAYFNTAMGMRRSSQVEQWLTELAKRRAATQPAR